MPEKLFKKLLNSEEDTCPKTKKKMKNKWKSIAKASGSYGIATDKIKKMCENVVGGDVAVPPAVVSKKPITKRKKCKKVKSESTGIKFQNILGEASLIENELIKGLKKGALAFGGSFFNNFLSNLGGAWQAVTVAAFSTQIQKLINRFTKISLDKKDIEDVFKMAIATHNFGVKKPKDYKSKIAEINTHFNKLIKITKEDKEKNKNKLKFEIFSYLISEFKTTFKENSIDPENKEHLKKIDTLINELKGMKYDY